MAGDVSSIGSSSGTYRALSGASAARTGVRRGASGNGEAADETASQTASQAGAASGTAATAVQQQVQKLKQADANVRQHEAAHQSAGGAHAGSASFTYTRGPDGKSYATAGEVQVDTSAETEPSDTIAKMEQVKAAALAPSDPSPQDLRVAAQADALKLKAQSELRGKGDDSGGDDSGGDGGTAAASPALAARGTAAYGAAQTLGRTSRGSGAGLVV